MQQKKTYIASHPAFLGALTVMSKQLYAMQKIRTLTLMEMSTADTNTKKRVFICRAPAQF